jgi:hypothetical protein
MSRTYAEADIRAGLARSTGDQWLTRVALLGASGFAVAATVGAIAAPDTYDSVRDTISILAAKDANLSWLMQGGFLALAAGLAAAAVALWRSLPFLSGRAASALLLVASGATAVAGLAQVECNPALPACQPLLEASASTTVHGRAALFVFLPLIITGFLLARATGRARMRLTSGVALWPIALIVATVDLGLVLAVEEVGTSIAGLLQRVFLTLCVGLPLLVVARRPSA